jgi:hypothetical protein
MNIRMMLIKEEIMLYYFFLMISYFPKFHHFSSALPFLRKNVENANEFTPIKRKRKPIIYARNAGNARITIPNMIQKSEKNGMREGLEVRRNCDLLSFCQCKMN